MFLDKRRLFSEFEWFCKRFERVKISVRHCKVGVEGKFRVEIPKRIERGPTDLLKALSKTVQRDPTAFHYKYPDDPYFAATSQLSKRSLALSLESGKRSARYIFENHPDFFKGISGEPFIKFETPNLPSVTDENEVSEINEETLKENIKERNVSKAISLYEILEQNNIEISKDTKQCLLELVCFYNCENKEKEEDLEIKWFESNRTEFEAKTWKDNGFAEKLFDILGPDCPLTCSAIIKGRLKYKQIEKGIELFSILREKKIPLPVSVYNEVLKNVINIKEGFEKRWHFIKEILKDMEEMKIQPDLFTMNAILYALYETRNWFETKSCATKVLGEFKKLEIEPSLGSYSYLLSILSYKNKDKSVAIAFAEELLSNLINMELEIRHPSDLLFFNNAMALFSLELKNSHLANLLNNLLWTKDNNKFISKAFHQNIYYRNYFNLIFGTQPLEIAMDIYRNLVPTVYTPEPQVNMNILLAIKREDGFEALVEVWQNLKQDSSYKSFAFLEELLTLAPLYKGEKGDKICKVFQEAATSVLELIKEKEKFEFTLMKSEDLLSNIFIAFVMANQKQAALKIIKMAFEEVGQLNGATLKLFCDFCVSAEEFSIVLACLKYGKKKKYPEVHEMAKIALPHLKDSVDSDLTWVEKLTKTSPDKKVQQEFTQNKNSNSSDKEENLG